MARATYENTIGTAELSTVWVDPDFDPEERAFYYVRVLEIPTPRWSTYDAVALGLDPEQATGRPASIQERAYSSPIWYTPDTTTKMTGKTWLLASLTLAVSASARPVTGQERSLYWGDTHVHTSYSSDAYGMGTVNADPETAYRFAKGLPVVYPGLGHRVRLDRPLDFLVVADHSPVGRGAPVEGDRNTPEFQEAAWSLYVDAAERNNDPGTFTALIGWEWTSTPGGVNLHRVVFTPTDAATAKGFLPLSTRDSPRPEDLWSWLEETSDRLGIDFVAIPHNSNLSNGLMFDMVDSDGRPISAEYARTRMRWEPLVEVLQMKGTSETHPFLSPEDEFANFELFPFRLLGGRTVIDPGAFVRTALLRGLQFEEGVGVNPYKLGIQGATDSHTSLSDGNEDLFAGRSPGQAGPAGGLTPAPPVNGRVREDAGVGWNSAAQGITGAWSTGNTREALTAAFKRKEVYATSGPRMQLRMFGGFEFEAEDADARDIAAVGYGGGVPMGGDLAQAPNGTPVSLLIHAVKDPVGANLDRVQVIKGWLDEDGETQERVYDVAWAGPRTAANGKVPPIGNTVDVARATYDNTIGSAELSTVWVDPDFDPDERAFYYVRVLEIPTPRWSTYDAVALGLDPEQATDRPAAIQERAYSSPIWYTP